MTEHSMDLPAEGPAITPSYLYHLPPIGIGTPFVEGLSSYVIRLARAHHVRPSLLINHICENFLEQRPLLNATPLLMTFDAGRKNKLVWIEVIEYLTQIRGLYLLTMLNWQDFFSSQRFIRRQNAYCPVCLNEQQADGIIYAPLLFRLQAVNCCPRHQIHLQTVCCHCGKGYKILSSQAFPGYCAHCHRWLGDTAGAAADKPSNLDLQIARGASELLQNVTELPFPEREHLVSFIQQVADSCTAQRKKVSQLEASTGGYQAWRRGRFGIDMRTFLRLCTEQLNLSPVAALAQQFHNRDHVLADDKRTRLLLSGFLWHDPALSVKQLARDLGLPGNQLYQQYPDLSRMLDHRFEVQREQVRQSRAHHLQMLLSESNQDIVSVRGVAGTLGCTVRDLKRDFPVAVQQLVQKNKALKAQALHDLKSNVQSFLYDTSLPPLSVAQVAVQVGLTTTHFRKLFPEESRLIAGRRNDYIARKRQYARAYLDELLICSDDLPLDLEGIAQYLGYNSFNYLKTQYPEQCRQLKARNDRLGLEKKLLRCERYLNDLLASPACPPMHYKITQELKADARFLCKHFPEPMARIKRKRQMMQDPDAKPLSARMLKNKQYMEELLAAKPMPFPSLNEVVKHLGYADSSTIQVKLPALCLEISECHRQNHQNYVRPYLEQILAENPEPFPSLHQIARDLAYRSVKTLRRRFPELCHEIRAREQAYRREKYPTVAAHIQQLLASGTDPLPTLAEIAKYHHLKVTAMTNNLPELCRAVVDRRRQQKHQILDMRRVHLETLIRQGHDGVPVPSLLAIAKAFNIDSSGLSQRYPHLCAQIKEIREQQNRAEKERWRQHLQAVIHADVKLRPSLLMVGQELGVSTLTLRKHFPEEVRQITDNYAAYRHELNQQHIAHECAAIRTAVFQLYQESGTIPLKTHVANHLGMSEVMRKHYQRKAYEDTIHELQNHIANQQAQHDDDQS